MTQLAPAPTQALPLWAAAQLLADWWSDPTDTANGAPRLPAGTDEIAVLIGEVNDVAALADEYEGLMVGPGRTPCPPYESMWQDDSPPQRGIAMGTAAGAVLALYRNAGLTMRPHPGELPDHLVVEWEAVAWSLEGNRAPEVARTLICDHLALWVPRFCEQVAAHASHPYYKALAALTPTWTCEIANRVQAGDIEP